MRYGALLLCLQLNACMYGHPLMGIFPEEGDSSNENLALLALAGFSAAGLSGVCTPFLFAGSITGCDLGLSGVVTTPYGPSGAGTPTGNTDATGNAARFLVPINATTDGASLFVSDAGNARVRPISLAAGAVTTLAGSTAGDMDGTGTGAQLNGLVGMTTDGTNLYIADSGNNKIRRVVIATGVVTVLAGPAAGATTSGDVDATGNAARFDSPYGITTDGNNLYVTETNNHKVRRIVIATGAVTTLAGDGTTGDNDGTGAAARFNGPRDVTTDGTHLYVADASNNKIRRIDISTAAVTTPYGPAAGTTTGGDVDATGNAARFSQPRSILTDGINLYIADTNNRKIRKIVLATGAVTTLAGDGTSGTDDGTGTAARFNGPQGLISDGTSLFVIDTNNHRIRRID